MSKLVTSPVWRGRALRKSVLGVAVAAALALPQVAAAMEFDLGNEDLTLRWDNTIRLNLVDRVAGQNKAMIANPNYDDGDRNFNVGSKWTRFDLYSEADLVWKQSWGALGARVSAAGWWDPGYDSLDNSSVQTSNHLSNGVPALGLPNYTSRYHKGASGEFMDWFLFSKFNIGEAPTNIKVGQTTVYWGESLLLGGAIHGISYSQNPIDIMKGLSTPGAEAKELFRPRVGFNIQSQVTDDLSVAAQYFFNWQNFTNQAYRYPESGSYLSVQDGYLFGGESIITGPNTLLGLPAATKGQLCGLVGLAGGSTAECFSQNYTRVWRTKDIEPNDNSGNYGLAVRWSPEWVDGTLGFYYRRTYDMQPQVMVTPDVIPGIPVAAANPLCVQAMSGLFVQTSATSGNCVQNAVDHYLSTTPPTPIFSQTAIDLVNNGRVGTYNLAFGSDINIFGVSLSKNVGGMSLGAEVSYRTNMPLLSDPVTVLPSALRPYKALPSGAIWSDQLPKNDTPGAKGDTIHALVNLVGVTGKSIWDTASWSTELVYSTYTSVTQNEAVFKGRSNHNPTFNAQGVCTPGPTDSWCAYQQIDQVNKNFFGLGINFTPTWFQVKPGMDLLAPLSWSQGISGNSAITSGGQEGAGTFGLGIALDFYQKYRFDLKYVGFYGRYDNCHQASTNTPAVGTCTASTPTAVAVFNGTNAVLSDRDFIALTFKTTF